MSSTGGPWDQPGGGPDAPIRSEEGRRAEVSRALVGLMRSQRAVADDDERLDGYLRDLCPQQPGEVSVLVVAARAGVPHDIGRATEGHPLEALAAGLASRLNAESGIDQGLARWAVDTWAVALGKMPEPAASAPAPSPPPAQERSASGAEPAPGASGADRGEMATRAPPSPQDPAASEGLRAMMAKLPPSDEPGAPPKPEPEPIAVAPTPEPRAPAPVVDAPPRTRTRPKAPAPPAPTPAAEPAGRKRRGAVVVVALAAAVVAVGAILFAVTKKGSSPRAAPATTAASAQPGPTAATTPPAPPQPLPTQPGRLAAGTYTTSTFRPGMTLAVDDTWKLGVPERSDYFVLSPADGAPAAIDFVRLSTVLRPDRLHRTASAVTNQANLEGAPDDVIGWLQANPNLSVGDPSPITAHGITGMAVEVNVPTGYQTELCQGPCVPMWIFENRQLGQGILRPANLYRIYAFNVGPQRVLAILTARPEQYGKFVPEADRIVASVTFPV